MEAQGTAHGVKMESQIAWHCCCYSSWPCYSVEETDKCRAEWKKNHGEGGREGERERERGEGRCLREFERERIGEKESE